MNTMLTRLILLQLLAWFGFQAGAQITMPITSLPSLVGEYNLSYVRTNTDISALIGHVGSNYWDFSQPQAANDVVARMNIVPVSDGGYGDGFAGAMFAEKFTGGLISGMSWEYYRLDASNGLVFYGAYDPVGYGADPSILPNPPTSVLPPSLFYGESWTNGYEFDVVDPYFGDIPVYYQGIEVVDAYGTLLLPGLGAVPALRITQNESYSADFDGTTVPYQSDTVWLWLTPGIGFAAQVVSYAPNTLSAAAQPYTNGFSRVFLKPPLLPSPAACLTLQSNSTALTWGSCLKASGYVVQTSTNLSLTNWMPVAQLTNQGLSVPVITGSRQQFFRVTAQP